jgi:hypothetical protein
MKENYTNLNLFIESLTGKKLTEDQNLSKIQGQLGDQLGGIFGKGGLGEGFGSMLSKGLWVDC